MCTNVTTKTAETEMFQGGQNEEEVFSFQIL